MHTQKIYSLLYLITAVALLLISTAFAYLPVSQDSASTINAAGLQRTRSQILVKSALILEDRPVAEHAQALSDMQVVLPLFQSEQEILLTDTDTTIQAQLVQARPDYLALIGATKQIISHADTSVDPVQVQIIVSHNMDYLHAINQLVTLLQNRAENKALQCFIIEAIIDMIVATLIILQYLFSRKSIKKEDVK